MKDSERIAKALVESVLPGVTMHYRYDQSKATHDFDLEYPDGRVTSLEVSESVNENLRETLVAIRRGYFVAAKHCRKDWIVYPTRDASIKEIRRRVDSYLAEIEASGCEGFFFYTDARKLPAVDRIFRDLKIERAAVMKLNPPGRICIDLPVSEAVLNAEHLQRAIETEANKLDNREKLGATKRPERHLFILISHENYSAWLSINDGDPPCTIPALPKEITHVWAAARTRNHNEFVIWRASSKEPWSHIGRIQLPNNQPSLTQEEP